MLDRRRNPRKRPDIHLPELPPYIFRNKSAGWLFLNGNIPYPRDLVSMFRHQILHPQHPDPQVDEERRVVLVTAAFESGHEFHDRHLISDFEEIGLDAGWRGGFPTKVRNLAVWSAFKRWKESEKWLYQRYTEKQDALLAIKRDYHTKMQTYVTAMLESLADLSGSYSELGLYEFCHLEDWRKDPAAVLPDDDTVQAEKINKQLEKLSKDRADSSKSIQLRHKMDHLVYKDSEVLAACKAIEDHFKHASGIEKSELYLAQKTELWHVMESAATIFMYGGRVYVLMNRLRFYDLDIALKQAVGGGSNVFGISAGSVIQTDEFALAIPNASGGHQIAADQGTDLIRNLRVFPHAYDYYKYMREASRNDLSFSALRHPKSVTVGLNQESVLLKETYKMEDKEYQRVTSVGRQPVLVFGPRGVTYEMEPGDQLMLEGCRHFDGQQRLARKAEVDDLEKDLLPAPAPPAGEASVEKPAKTVT